MRRCQSTAGGWFFTLLALTFASIGTTVVRTQENERVLSPIWNVTATSNAVASDDETGPENAVNGSGLNASDEHSTRGGMWIATPKDEPVYIQFEFDDVYELEEMWVWNYNGVLPLGGIEDAAIEYSQNGTDWMVFGDVVCAEASYQNNYVANTIVPLQGIRARYVRLTILSTRGFFSFPAVSEVRFWTFAEATYQIHNVVATSNVIADGPFGPENTVNDSGMNANGGHSTDMADAWLVAPDHALVYIQFQFDGLYDLESMWVWNCNGLADFGAKDVTIEYSEDGVNWMVFGNVQFARASGKADYAANTRVSLDGIAAQHLRLTIHSSWAEETTSTDASGEVLEYEHVGLSEVRFFTQQSRPAGNAPPL